MNYVLADTEVTYTPLTKKDMMCTVYFPHDCDNNCKFCTSKPFYLENVPNKEKVLEWLKSLSESNVSDFVITGGEVMTDLELLIEMLEILKHKTVYINTTFLNKNKDRFIEIVNHYPNIKGINISRHCETFEMDNLILSGVAPDEDILKINTNVRINCYVGMNINQDKMAKILYRWEKIWKLKEKNTLDVSFRHDYNRMTEENLHILDTESIKSATELANYYGRVYCHVCDKVLFKTKNGMSFRIHRGLQNTRISFGNIVEMQELVLFPDGVLCTDWDKTTDGLEEYLEILNIQNMNQEYKELRKTLY